MLTDVCLALLCTKWRGLPSAGISELRLDVGPGYRVYFVLRGRTLIILLCGGDKRTQNADIKRAKDLAADL